MQLAVVDISLVFQGQRLGIILRMSHNKEAAVVTALHSKYACLVRGGQQLELGACQNVLFFDGCVTGVGGVKGVIKAAEPGGAGANDFMGKDAEHLLGQRVLVDSIVVKEARLGTPTDVQCA